MALSRKTVLLAAGGASLLALGAASLAMRGPMEPPREDLSSDLATAYDAVEAGELKLSPAAKISMTVMQADGVPQRNAPSFAPRRIDPVGAVPVVALHRRAVLVKYRGDTEGAFAVMSLPGKPEDYSQDAGVIEFQNRRLSTFERPGPNGAPLHGVGEQIGTRLVFVVGPQPLDKLAALAVMVPPV